MSRVVNRERRRAELDAAAATAFAAKGVAGTAVSDIVSEAGAAKGTFYLYFATKDDAGRSHHDPRADQALRGGLGRRCP